ncbi:MAG: hypothetical protein LIP23_01380, partial [Planctomycetes bacterium]|nr:hypothetical protein [Planctomycetota bacterium]
DIMTTTINYSERKKKLTECCDEANPVSRHIIDADCAYEDGVFKLYNVPARLPLLFTVRFTAPAVYAAGNTITLKGQEFEVKTSGMEPSPDGTFAAGAVVQCDIDMERNLAFISASHNVGEEHTCYFPRVDLYVETTGDDDAGDGSLAAPLKSIHGVFALLERKYNGHIRRLRINLGHGHFSAPRTWFDFSQDFSVERMVLVGKNTDSDPSASTVGDSGCDIYGMVQRIDWRSASIVCNDDTADSVLRLGTNYCRFTLVGCCQIVNSSTKATRGAAIYNRNFLVLGSDTEICPITFSGNFTDVIYTTNAAHVNAQLQTKIILQGSSSNFIFANGGSLLYLAPTEPPQFSSGFRGNIRARNGATIAINSTSQVSNWLPTGSQWVKDDISRITGY